MVAPQAAALVEALEAESTCLLLDEDTSATNFMIRDRRMQALVAKASLEERSHFQKMVIRIGDFLIMITVVLVVLIVMMNLVM